MPRRHEVTVAGGEQVRAFVPFPLPPNPPLVMDGRLQRLIEGAVLALDLVPDLLPGPTPWQFHSLRGARLVEQE